MQTEKFKVLLYLKRSGLDKSGQAPIMGRITYGRTMAQFSCKLSCNPDLWNARESRLNGKSREAVITNGKLEQLLLSVQSAYRRLCERGAIFTAADIKEQVQGSMQSQTTFLWCYDLMLEELKMRVGIDLKPASMRIYHLARQYFVEFIHRQFRTNDMTFSQITEDFLFLFEQYIKGESGLSQSYFHTLSVCLKKACRLAYSKGFSDRPLFENSKVEQGNKKLPRALDKVSLEKLQSLTFEAYEIELEAARDLFLFSCFTGVAYCDMVALDREHLFTDGEGGLWLKFRRQKTGALCRVKLLPEAVRLMERYRSDERITLFAPVPYPSYLSRLKALQLRAGISIPLSAHMARHREFYKRQIINRLCCSLIKGGNDKETSKLLYSTLFCHFKEPLFSFAKILFSKQKDKYLSTFLLVIHERYLSLEAFLF